MPWFERLSIARKAGETDPTKFDSDGDGVWDGRELGVTVNPDATNCSNTVFNANVKDADPATTARAGA